MVRIKLKIVYINLITIIIVVKLQLILHLAFEPLIFPILLKYKEEKNKLKTIKIAYIVEKINDIMKETLLNEHKTKDLLLLS
jgi:hypothetical protein